MPFARRNVRWPHLAALAVLAAPASLAVAAETEAELGRTWHGPATMAAEAAAKQAAKEAIVPPLPKPARPPVTESAPDAAKPAEPAKPVEKTAATPPTDEADTKASGNKNADTPKKKALTAKQLFGTVKSAAPLTARAVGWYAKGCLAGGKPIAVDGPGWQVMRLSRNRNWGHPNLVALIERLAREATKAGEWPGLLVGDMSQPRGGPMISGHTSHQVGLDADIWLTPMPDRTLTRREREDMSAVSMLKNAGEVNPKVWGDGQVKLIKRAASYPAVERILVHPALKKALCEAAGTNRTWLGKVRPYFGHYYHFHVRIGCPKGSDNCRAQPPVPDGDGCGQELTDWLKRVAPKPKPKPPATAEKPPAKPAKPAPPKPEMTLADLPPDCSTVLTAGGHVPPTEPAVIVDRSKDAGPVKDMTVRTAAPSPPPAAKKTPTKAATN
ncbi:penicillin-insensitive murein endopeptidase [Hyphomicrobium sp. CS1GBMeth3]|uniref:penicillin-insensitive murein endopeptidase n=1 Tax=Hyphomicrobium sp. CS1GBMeth3 TaxID=1892845 RepID=UPI000B1D4611|nr:penicillin-insensitive murein endopeptidase [Hyphomicrobium sp. CS1GBMeth3]